MDVSSNYRGLFIFEGIAFIIFGMLAIAFPVLSTLGFELFLGWLFLISGLIQAYRAFQLRHQSGVAYSILGSLIAIIIGCLLLAYPLSGVISLTILLIIYFIIDGVSKITWGFRFRFPRSGRWWLFFSGIISLIMAAIIWSGWPATASWVLGLLIGINMVFFGSALLGVGFSLPKIKRD